MGDTLAKTPFISLKGEIMGRNKQPIDILVQKGKKNLTKKEIEERTTNEIRADSDKVLPPRYLSTKQKKEFKLISSELIKVNLITNLDVDTLARYIISKDNYIEISAKMRETDVIIDDFINENYEKLQKIQDNYFKQLRNSAMDLGLTVTSRLKLSLPPVKPEEKKNKFGKFEN